MDRLLPEKRGGFSFHLSRYQFCSRAVPYAAVRFTDLPIYAVIYAQSETKMPVGNFVK
jgi:hypothetical protein